MEKIIRATATLTEVATDTRTFTGLAAPYNYEIDFEGQLERIAPGAFATAIPVKVYYNHLSEVAKPVAVVESYNDTEQGLEFTARFDDTELATEVYEALKRGELDGLSIQGVSSASHMDGDVLVYDAIELFEISIVDKPAYDTARVSVVRSAEHTQISDPNNSGSEAINTKEDSNESIIMENELNTYDDSELRSEVADIRRMLEVASTKEDEAPALTIKSFGEYIKRYATGDDEALNLRRSYTYTGGTTADSVIANGWTADIIKVVDNGRPEWNLWSKGQWVEEGNNIEYAKLNTNTVDVSSQANEGDVLSFGKVSVTSAYTPKLTRGGYTEMSAQEIKRSNVNILGVAFEAMAAEYASDVNALAHTALTGASATNLAGFTLDLNTADSWVEFLVKASLALKAKGLAPDFVAVSSDVYVELAKLSKTDSYVLNRDSGNVNVTGLGGNVLSLPVEIVGTASDTNFVRVANKSAIKTFEAPGAPFNLQDENILNLTKQFSIWGEVAVAVQDAAAIVKANAIS